MSIVTTDIRGVSRPQGSAYDIGAYEGAGGTAYIPSVPDDTSYVPPPSTPPASGSIVTRPAASIPLIPCTPRTLVSSPSRNAGCNEGGVGWTPTYTGASGVVPVGANPTDGELLTGKRTIYLYAQMTHRNYV